MHAFPDLALPSKRNFTHSCYNQSYSYVELFYDSDRRHAMACRLLTCFARLLKGTLLNGR